MHLLIIFLKKRHFLKMLLLSFSKYNIVSIRKVWLNLNKLLHEMMIICK